MVMADIRERDGEVETVVGKGPTGSARPKGKPGGLCCHGDMEEDEGSKMQVDGEREKDAAGHTFLLQIPDDPFEDVGELSVKEDHEDMYLTLELMDVHEDGKKPQDHCDEGVTTAGKTVTTVCGGCGNDGTTLMQPHHHHHDEDSQHCHDLIPNQLEFELVAYQVIERIENCFAWLLHAIQNKQNPIIVMPLLHGTKHRGTLCLDSKRKGQEGRFERLWTVLNLCHENLINDTECTQRDLFYRMKAMPEHRYVHAGQVKSSIEDAVHLLQVPRFSLGISSSSKGLVSGPLVIAQHSGTSDPVSCLYQTSPHGVSIPGNIKTILDMKFECFATHVIVVEKDTVFQRLVAHAADDSILKGCLFITGRGHSDMGTRIFLWRIHQVYPNIPILGICDWNPCGALILGTYRFGSQNMAESIRFRLEHVRWLGMRRGMLEDFHSDVFHPLSDRDMSMASMLVERWKETAPEWVKEVECMLLSGVKADIEALYTRGSIGDICQYLVKEMLECRWV